MSLFENTSPINLENVDKTIENFKKKFEMDKYPSKVIGSAGKKDVSGDIDIAVSKVAEEEAVLILNTFCFFPEVKVQTGIGIVSCSFPIQNIDGKQEGKYVQIDLMLTENIFLADYLYWAPGSKFSKYGGAQRSAFLMAIAKVINFTVLETFWDIYLKEEFPSKWTRYILDRKGLSLALQSNRDKDSRILSKPKTLERMLITTSPTTINEILLVGIDIGITDSFEKLWVHTKKIYPNKFDKICKEAILMLHKNDDVIPKELLF